MVDGSFFFLITSRNGLCKIAFLTRDNYIFFYYTLLSFSYYIYFNLISALRLILNIISSTFPFVT